MKPNEVICLNLLVSLIILAFGPGRVSLDNPAAKLLCKTPDHG